MEVRTKIRVRHGVAGRFLLLILSVAFTLGMRAQKPDLVAATPSDEAALRTLQVRVQAAIRKVSPAIVAIQQVGAEDGKPHLYLPYASGVLISADGLVLSQFHVSHRYPWNSGEPVRSRKPGERTKVILSDGRERQAELLGADQSYDFSLLRLVEPGPYPYVSFAPEPNVRRGDWMLKFGHPVGYRQGRPPVVRLGRVLVQGGSIFVTDCNITGGDSGGPFIDLDGRIVGMVGDSQIPPALKVTTLPLPEMLFNADTSSVIQQVTPRMLQREIAPDDFAVRKTRVDRLLKAGDILPVAQWTQGSATGAAFRKRIESVTACVVELLDAGNQQVELGTVVASDGWILTVASLLPAKPRCRLPDQQVVPARVIGVNPEFDLALLKVKASHLHPIPWDRNRPGTVAGTLLAAPAPTKGSGRSLLGIGVVSVATRDLPGPFSRRREHPQVRAEEPHLFGMPTERGFRLDTFDAAAAKAGIRSNDILVSIGKRPIRTQEDVLRTAEGRKPGERLVVRVLREMNPLEFSMVLSSKPLVWSRPYADFPTLFEHDMPLLPSQCGGPVIDLEGQAAGITMFRGEYGCMAVPANVIVRLLPELLTGRSAGISGKAPKNLGNTKRP